MQNIKEIFGFHGFLLPVGEPSRVVGDESQGIKSREYRYTNRFPQGKEDEKILYMGLPPINPRYHSVQKESIEEILDRLNETAHSRSFLPDFSALGASMT
jgi:hypothetical protein